MPSHDRHPIEASGAPRAPDGRDPAVRFLAPADRPSALAADPTEAAARAGMSTNLDVDVALRLVAFGGYDVDRSFVAGVRAARARAVVEERDAILEVRDPAGPPALTLGRDAAAAALRESLAAAVRSALAPARRVAVLASGGLDSSAVAVLVAEAWRREGRRCEDLRLVHEVDSPGAAPTATARALADRLALDLRLVPPPDGDPYDGSEAFLAASAFPFDGDSPGHWLAVARGLARDGFDLVLTGDGGDEAVGSYGPRGERDPTWPAWGPARRLAAAARPWLRRGAEATAPGALARRRTASLPPWLAHLARRLGPPAWEPTARPGLRGAAAARDRALRSARQGVIVEWGRAASRAFGFRVAHPFLDAAVEDVAVAVPQALHVDGAREKALLRAAFASDFPPIVAEQRKDESPGSLARAREEVDRRWPGWVERFVRAGALERAGVARRDLESMGRVASGADVASLHRPRAVVAIEAWCRARGLAPA
jgi:asparagine synthase (glutamine-hydrolysing)